MITALWIIAACEVIRAIQNFIQLGAIFKDGKDRHNAYAEFVKSLKQSDKEFVEDILKEFEEREAQNITIQNDGTYE